MMLTDLLATLETQGALKPSRVPAMKTSLKSLAVALGHGSPAQCPVDAAGLQEATWAKALEDHWRTLETGTLETAGRTISAYTRRNTKNDIRKIVKLAAARGLLEAPLPPRLLAKPQRKVFERQQRETSPFLPTAALQTGPRHYGLPQEGWPPDIQAGWQAYQDLCGLRLRSMSLRLYAQELGRYFGYQAHICGRTPGWEDLFDVAQLRAFVRWHGARVGCQISTQARHVVIVIAAMAKVIGHPHARALADFRNTLKPPERRHSKRADWVSLATLEAVADAWLAEGRVPYVPRASTQYPGLHRASRFQRGLMLKLLVRVPLRQRNVRELRLEHNLYRDPGGHWQLHFSGAELKVGERQGRINEYKMDLTEDTENLIPVLEEFLRDYRPRLPGAATSPFLFLMQSGAPFTASTLYHELSVSVAMRTGKRFYPHLIRTIWATAYLKKYHSDFTGAAVMLGDTVAVVMRTYHDVVDQDYHAKAKVLLGTELHTG